MPDFMIGGVKIPEPCDSGHVLWVKEQAVKGQGLCGTHVVSEDFSIAILPLIVERLGRDVCDKCR